MRPTVDFGRHFYFIMIPRKTTEQFIEDSKKLNGDFYNYLKTIYTGCRNKLIITCPVHGDFEQTPVNHLNKKQKCRECSMEKVYKTRKSLAFTTEQFINKANKIHNFKFDYSKSIYVNSGTKLIISCPVHGESEIEPRHHYKGTGCYGCGRDKFSEGQKKYKTLAQLIEKFITTHGNKYCYLNIDNKFPVHTTEKISIECEKHGYFKQNISHHILGAGCPKCRFYGYSKKAFVDYCREFDKDLAKVYLLKFFNKNELFYKIGITARTIKERYRKELERGGYKYEIISKISLLPDKAWDKEEKIKDIFSEYCYKPNNWFPGYTECFTSDLPIEEIIKTLNFS